MSDPFSLLSSATIGARDFEHFLGEIGGVVDLERAGTGRISNGKRHVWLFWSAQTLAEIIEEPCEAIAERLGAVPRSCVVLELSHAPDSDKLAIDFSIAFAERWPSVLSDFSDSVLSLVDLRRLRDESKGLYPTFPPRSTNSP